MNNKSFLFILYQNRILKHYTDKSFYLSHFDSLYYYRDAYDFRCHARARGCLKFHSWNGVARVHARRRKIGAETEVFRAAHGKRCTKQCGEQKEERTSPVTRRERKRGRDSLRAREPARYSLFELGIPEVGDIHSRRSAQSRLCGSGAFSRAISSGEPSGPVLFRRCHGSAFFVTPLIDGSIIARRE